MSMNKKPAGTHQSHHLDFYYRWCFTDCGYVLSAKFLRLRSFRISAFLGLKKSPPDRIRFKGMRQGSLPG
jgi:hypothetical protein